MGEQEMHSRPYQVIEWQQDKLNHPDWHERRPCGRTPTEYYWSSRLMVSCLRCWILLRLSTCNTLDVCKAYAAKLAYGALAFKGNRRSEFPQ